MGEVNWVVSLVFGAALSIPIGFIVSIVANLATPLTQDWLDKRALSIRGKRLETLKEEYERVKELHDNPAGLYLTVNRHSIMAFRIIILFINSLTLWLMVMIVFFLVLTKSSPFLAEIIPTEVMFVIGLLTLLSSLLCPLSFFVYIVLRNLWKDLARLLKFAKYEADIVARIKNLEDDLPDDRDLPQPNES